MGNMIKFVCRCCGKETGIAEPDLDMCTDALPDTTLWILKTPLVDIWKYGRELVEKGEHPYFTTVDEIDTEYERMCANGADVNYAREPRKLDDICVNCKVRGGLCQHNYNDHQEMGAHSSRPHWDDSGAADPSTCRWCRNSVGVQKGIPRVTKPV